jgi:hypothetical protein
MDASFTDAIAPDAGAGCSLDLHSVIDEDGGILQACPPDQGCANGLCVGACQAAAAAHGTLGCDFIVATPSFYAANHPKYFSPCHAIFLANDWAANTHVEVTRAGVTYNPSLFGYLAKPTATVAAWPPIVSTGIPYGEVGVLFMDHDPKSMFLCPFKPAIGSGTAVEGTGRGRAWHVTTSSPVSAYDILPFGGAKSALPGATLLYPTSAWGRNYIATLPLLGSGTSASQGGPHWGQIVALEDGTTVDVVPTVDLPFGADFGPAPKNAKSTFTLSAGEFIQWQAPYDENATPCETTPMDMSGSILSSSQPFAFNGGNGYLCLGSSTSDNGGCDSDHEQIAPISALGSEYAVVPFEPRPPFDAKTPESVLYRFTGVVDGTALTYDPAVTGAPQSIALGQVVDFETTRHFVVRSQDAQHPFHVAVMMPGSGAIANSLGDEDYVQLVPPGQFLTRYVFFVDLTYPTTTLTVIRKKTAAGFSDVTIECNGQLGNWKPIDAADTYEFTWVDGCQGGEHRAKSAGPFGVTVWGLAAAASYGYPVGGSLLPLNTVVVPPNPH